MSARALVSIRSIPTSVSDADSVQETVPQDVSQEPITSQKDINWHHLRSTRRSVQSVVFVRVTVSLMQ